MAVSIGLIGAPGAGKSHLAQALVKQHPVVDANEDGTGYNPGFFLIDDVAIHISEMTGRAIGGVGDYDTNLMVYFERSRREDKFRSRDDSFVSAGTIVETLVHAGLATEVTANGLRTAQTEQRLVREIKTVEILSLMMVDRLHYDHLFYLSLPEQIVLPGGQDEADRLFNQNVDALIQDVITRFALPVVTLQPDRETRIKQVNQILEESRAEAGA